MDFKKSNYVVITEEITPLDGIRILFATRTAKTLKISRALYNAFIKAEWHNMSQDDFDKLLVVEAIVPSCENELSVVIKRNKAAIADMGTLYHVIQPSAMCQLGCSYCGQTHTKNNVSSELYESLLGRIESKFEGKQYRHVQIGWFGGEPLMGYAQIRDLTPKLQAMATLHGCTYSGKVVTNGLSLKESVFLELVQKFSVNEIEVTLDGIATYHDTRRHTKEGLGTFDLILRNLKAIFSRPDFKTLGCSVSIRCNVDERNREGVTPLIHLLAAHELQDKIAYFYVAPIHSWGNNAHELSVEKQEFAEEEIGWILEQLKAGFSPQLIPHLNPVVCLSVTPDAEVFDAFGNVFDCTETPYVDSYKDTNYVLGNLGHKDNSISEYRPLINFNDEVLSGQYPCATCCMLPVCGGGCPKSWREGMAPCPTNKFNIESKLALSYALQKTGKSAVLETLAAERL